MSLRVWIPGSKDFIDQGQDNIQWINDNVTLNNSGKIGKCLYFNGTNARLSTTNFNIGNEFSYCCWYKDEDATRTAWGYVFLLNTTGGDTASQLGLLTKPNEHRCECVSNGQYYSTISYESGTWNHFAVTYNGTSMKYYLNGAYLGAKTITQQLTHTNLTIGARNTSESGGHTSATSYFCGFINDVRIYDHVISEKEIKLISMGMVRHYPLDNNGMGMPNVLQNSLVNVPAAYHSTTRTIERNVPIPEFGCKDGIRIYGDGGDNVIPLLLNHSTHGILPEALNDNNASISGQKYTSTIYIKNNHESNAISVSFNNLSGTSAVQVNPKEAKKIVQVGRGNGNNNLQFTFIRPEIGCEYDIIIWHPKIELSDHATPWCPAVTDAAYADIAKEFDVSGNRYDGTKVGTITYNCDSAKYLVSTSFDGTAENYINADCLPAETKTVSLWVKIDSLSSADLVGFADHTTHLAFGFKGADKIITYCGNANGGAGSQVLIGNNYKEGEWNHFVIISNGDTTMECWLNGVKLANTTNYYWSHTTPSLMIGRRSATSKAFNGSISDFRAYATILSEDDIQELYHAGISISNTGTMIAPEFVEVY